MWRLISRLKKIMHPFRRRLCCWALLPPLFSALPAQAQNFYQSQLTISRIRAVADYSGPTFDNTIELWFTQPLVWPAGAPCTSTFRVFVDTRHKHLLTTAYLAHMSGRKLSVNVDASLPIRDGACEVSFMDLDQ